MMPCRGMGDINPKKMPKGTKKERRDDTDFEQYAKGGKVWDKPRPKKLGKSKELTEYQKGQAKSRARRSGRPYPNLIDNMWAVKD